MDLSCSSESYSILQSEELSGMPIRLCHGDLVSSIPLHEESQFIDIPQGFSRFSSIHTSLSPSAHKLFSSLNKFSFPFESSEALCL